MDNARKLQIVEETREHYNGHPERLSWSQEHRNCVYRAEGGQRCAVGRYLGDDEDLLGIEGSFSALYCSRHQDKLRAIPEFSSFDDDAFWKALQNTHDRVAVTLCEFGTGLSPEAKVKTWATFNDRLDNIKDAINGGYY